MCVCVCVDDQCRRLRYFFKRTYIMCFSKRAILRRARRTRETGRRRLSLAEKKKTMWACKKSGGRGWSDDDGWSSTLGDETTRIVCAGDIDPHCVSSVHKIIINNITIIHYILQSISRALKITSSRSGRGGGGNGEVVVFGTYSCK